MTSSFVYESDGFISGMTTPYGTTTFRREHPMNPWNPFIEATNPAGETERLEYRWASGGIPASVPSSEVPAGFAAYNQNLNMFNVLYWDARAWKAGPGSVETATISHLMLVENVSYSNFILSPVPHSVKRPLEGRVWYSYPEQTDATQGQLNGFRDPTRTARVLSDATTQLWQKTYNEKRQVTSEVDPLGRTTTYTYAANGINLLEVRQTTGGVNDLLAQYGGYNSQGLPLTVVDAAGQTTTYAYNTSGQVTSVTNALEETTTYAYNANGQLQSITGPVSGATTSYTYDGYGRVRTVTADGYTTTTDYDALNRPTRTTFPDGTYEELTYDKLDVVARRDRAGRVTRHFFDAAGRATATRDTLGRLVQHDENRLIDANGNRTAWERDVQGRVTRELRADGVTATVYTYDQASGLLRTVTDPKGQVTTYSYHPDNAVQSLVFTNAAVATPSVSFTYDAAYNRVTMMQDGTGTSTYSYHPAGAQGAGQVATVDGPMPNDTITYEYDALGRLTERAINGVALALDYDGLGRVTQEVNALGTFTYSYHSSSGRLAAATYPNGQTSTYSYLPAALDHRLQTIHHKYPSGQTLSRFDYTYDAVGNILTWRQQADADPAVRWRYRYDAADQLIEAIKESTEPSPVLLNRYTYRYDPAGNRLLEQIDASVKTWTYDALNRIVEERSNGVVQVVGTISEPGTVTINGQPMVVSPENAFEGLATLTEGTSTFNVTATDLTGNTTSQNYQVNTTGPTRTFTFDANGNLTSDATRTFEWDARNQLAAINLETHRLQFAYDGLQRRVQIISTDAGLVQANHLLMWCEVSICEERDTSGAVIRRLVGQGEEVQGEIQLFGVDHLGSLHAVTDASGALLERFSYDPFGRRSPPSTSDVSRAYSGHYRLEGSGELSLAMYRVYDPSLATWSSEDPLRLASDDLNLYGYVQRNPIARTDPFGLAGMGFTQAMTMAYVCDYHRIRNRWNQCPPREPKGNPDWSQDGRGLTVVLRFFGGSGTRKYRHKNGYECAYDSCGDLQPDDGKNYTYNYEPNDPVRHVTLDVMPTFFCGPVQPGQSNSP